MTQKKYDLHMHSTISDGSLNPKEIVDEAVKLGLTGISLTDHDTVDAYTEEFFQYASEKGLTLIPGVEFSSEFEGVGVHILGYFLEVDNLVLQAFCKMHIERRKERNQKILHLLQKEGIDIVEEELEYGKVIGRPHIAALMVKKGYVGTISDAFSRYIGDGKKCFYKGKKFSIEETIAIIHEAKGKAVLAHPILLKKKTLIRKLLTKPFDGMECFYANFSARQNEEMCALAGAYKLVPTGGSDFHGLVKPYSKMGSAYTTEENLERLKHA